MAHAAPDVSRHLITPVADEAVPLIGAPSKSAIRARADVRLLPDDARLLDLRAIAVAGGVSLRTTRSWVSSGQLRVMRLGRSVRVRVSDWKAFLDRRQG